MVQFANGKAMASGFLATPEKEGRYPAVLVIPEWWGVTDWAKEQTKKLATEGFVALAVDFYDGKVATDSTQVQQLFYAVTQDQAVTELQSAFAYLQTRKDVDHDRLAAVGWGSGGGYALQLAIHQQRLAACVVNYGVLPTDPNDTQLIFAAVMGNFGGEDHGVPPADAQSFEKSMTSQGRRVDIKIYDGVGHGFASPDDGSNYNAAAAADAWSRTVKFLNKILR
jgi:carboxymethylenebutenolidase